MSGITLTQERDQKRALMIRATTETKQRKIEYAKAEKNYRIALAQKYLVELAQGTPVTAIRDIARGDPEIAELKFKRDVAEGLHDSAREAINVYKLEVRIIDDQIKREWGTSG